MAEDINLEIIYPLAIGTSIMLLLAVAVILFFVYYQKRLFQEQMQRKQFEAETQRHLLSATIKAQETERRRIAKDLHDEIGAMLATIRLGIARIAKKTQGEGMHQLASETKTMVDDTLSNVRRISKDLMPATLDEFGLSKALKVLSKKIADTTGLAISFEQSGPNIRLEPEAELALYRITQELLNNALRHSGADTISIRLQTLEDSLLLSVSDNGSGFDLETAKQKYAGRKGLGLSSIESRASVLHAILTYDTKTGSGTQVHVNLPLPIPVPEKIIA